VADKNPPLKRWIIIKMLQHAIERTEAEIAELKAAGLFVRDASGSSDVQVPAAGVTAATPTTPPPPVPASGAQPETEETP
jgi:hypothetical protein